jgi:hypothetical protein
VIHPGINKSKCLFGLVNEPSIGALRGILDDADFIEVEPILLDCLIVSWVNDDSDWCTNE